MTDVPDLTLWLSACYDAVEQAAEQATPGPWMVADSGEVETVARFGSRGYETPLGITRDSEGIQPAIDGRDAAYVAAHDPAWRLGDIARKRQMLAEHGMNDFGASLVPELADEHDPPPICTRCHGDPYYESQPYPCLTVRLLAAEFEGRDGYQEAWRP